MGPDKDHSTPDIPALSDAEADVWLKSVYLDVVPL